MISRSPHPHVSESERRRFMAKHPVKALPYANDALKGIGAKTIEIHHDKLYAGYVNKRNEIEEALTGVDRSKANQIYSQMRGLKHEETFAANGQILHELYFGVMGGDGQPAGEVFDKIKEDFGDRKSTRLNSSHSQISYAVFCLKKKNKYHCCHLKNIWTAPLPPETELSRQMTRSTTSIDIMGLKAAYANLHTD